MEKLLTKTWWKAAGIRAIKTFSQTFIGSITVGMAISDVDWLTVSSVSAVASILSLFTSIAGLPEINEKEEKD